MKKIETDLIPQQIKKLSNDCSDCYWYKSIDGFISTDDLSFIYDQVEYLIPLKHRLFEERKTQTGKLLNYGKLPFEGSGFTIPSKWSTAGFSSDTFGEVEVKLKDKVITQMSTRCTFSF